jgi:hypothetical protein
MQIANRPKRERSVFSFWLHPKRALAMTDLADLSSLRYLVDY